MSRQYKRGELRKLLLSMDTASMTVPEISDAANCSAMQVNDCIYKAKKNGIIIHHKRAPSGRKPRKRTHEPTMQAAQPSCNGCRHWRSAGSGNDTGLKACHYLLDMGHMRGCPPGDECTKRREGIWDE